MTEEESGLGDAQMPGRPDAADSAVSPREEIRVAAEAPAPAASDSPPAGPADAALEQPPVIPAAETRTPVVDRRTIPRGPHPLLSEQREPVSREQGGYRLHLEPSDLAKLRELPGAKGKTDQELGEQFLDAQASRLIASVVEDVAPPAELRVLVDPYSRQAFLALGRTIRGIISF